MWSHGRRFINSASLLVFVLHILQICIHVDVICVGVITQSMCVSVDMGFVSLVHNFILCRVCPLGWLCCCSHSFSTYYSVLVQHSIVHRQLHHMSVTNIHNNRRILGPQIVTLPRVDFREYRGAFPPFAPLGN